MNELVVGIAGSGKTRYCVERCHEAMTGGRRVLYLVPNRDEAEQLRRRLLDSSGAKALFLPGIVYFRTLLARVLDPLLPGWTLRSPLSRRLALRRLLGEQRGRLGPLEASACTPGFLSTLDEFFRELEDADLEPATLADFAAGGAAAPRLRVLADLYERHAGEQLASSVLDESWALERATRLLVDPASPPDALPGEDALLIADGFSDFHPRQLHFLEALLPSQGETLLSLCLDPADLEAEARPPFERLHALARRFTARDDWRVVGLERPRRFSEPVLAEISRRLFRILPGQGRADRGEALVLIEAATRRDEVEGVLRELRRAIAGGTPPEAMGIFFWHDDYAQLFGEVLGREGIPFRSSRRRSLLPSAAVDTALSLLDWAAGEQPPRDLPQRLRGGFVGTPDPLLSALHAEARARGVPGRTSWDDLLAELRPAEPEADWDWLDWREDLPAGDVTGEAFVAAFVRPLVGLLAGHLSRRLSAGLEEAARQGDAVGEAALDLPALESLLQIAETVAREAVSSAGERLPASQWTGLLREALEDARPPSAHGHEGGGVQMGNPRLLRMPELDRVFVCGLNQGVFPPPVREHPLLHEAERRALNARLRELGRSSRLRSRENAQAESRYHFYIAATRASRRLTLSWSLRDADGRPTLRSFYLDELLGLCGEEPAPRAVPSLSLVEKLRDPVSLRSLTRDVLLAAARGEAGELATAAESWLEERGLGEHLAEARRRRGETPLAEHPALAPQLASLDRFSASRLEAYAECPYRFLMEKILGLEEEHEFEAGAREEGSWYHKVLQLFYADWDGRCEPAPEELDAGLAELGARAEEILAHEEGEGAFLSPRFRAENPRRLRVLRSFLERDLRRLATSGYRPAPESLERAFTLESVELAGEERAAPFRVSGTVDRVDGGPAGGGLVIDYKRSKKDSEAPDAEAPRLFQLALYAMAQRGEALGAVYCALREGKPFRGYLRAEERDALADWIVGGRKGSPKGGHWLEAAEWDAWLEHMGQRLRELVESIRAGRLDAAPAEKVEDTCARCGLGQLCRWRAEEAAGQPAGSPGGEGGGG